MDVLGVWGFAFGGEKGVYFMGGFGQVVFLEFCFYCEFEQVDGLAAGLELGDLLGRQLVEGFYLLDVDVGESALLLFLLMV